MISHKGIIGVDESGKGDFFGPLVICAFLADDSSENRLREAGVKDGKLLSEKRIIEIDDYLREVFPHSIVTLMPSEYNQKYDAIKNLNKLLAWGHATAIDEVMKNNVAYGAISDKFGTIDHISGELKKKNNSIKLKQIVRGESIIQVAAASIIARAEFLRQMDKLSREYGYDIPRGASSKVDEAGRELVDKFGSDILKKIAKLHFKNYQRVIKQTML